MDMGFIWGGYEMGTRRVLIKRVWSGYGERTSSTHTHTYTHTHFSNTRPIPIFFQFSPPIPIPIGADFADFRWVRIFLPTLCLFECG